MRIGVGEVAADRRDVAHAHVGERAQRARDHRRSCACTRRGVLERGERRHRADAQLAVRSRLRCGVARLDPRAGSRAGAAAARRPSSSASARCRRRSGARSHRPGRAARSPRAACAVRQARTASSRRGHGKRRGVCPCGAVRASVGPSRRGGHRRCSPGSRHDARPGARRANAAQRFWPASAAVPAVGTSG